MKKRLIPLALSLVLLAGCAGGNAVTPGGSAASIEPVPDVPGEVGIVDLDLNVEGDPYAAYAAFAVELLRQSRVEGENALLSPLSVVLALGMTANGASGDTLEEFEALFGMDMDTLNAFCAQLLADYRDLGGSTESTLVNSLWCDPDLTLDGLFTARCQQIYDAQLFQADLQDPATVEAVNHWVSEATRGLIPQAVDEFDKAAVLALVNAIYLKNQFERPFETPTREWHIDFTAADGTVTEPLGMSNGERTETYLSHEGGQGVVLPYDDGRLGLLLMLPDEGVSLTDYLATWNGETVKALLDGAAEELVYLSVPKFKAEWGSSLADILANMGLADAFDPDTADFSAMGTTANGYPLYIGDVIHKTAFDLNEKGTEAAAVTVVTMECGSAPLITEPIVLRYDRPFVYGIVELTTGTPLFLGTAERVE